MAFSTSRTFTSRRRPPRLAGRIIGSINAHSPSVRSLGYRSPLRAATRRCSAVHIWCLPQSPAPHIESQPIPPTQQLSGSALRIYGFLELVLALVSLAVTAFLSHWSIWAGWLSSMLDLDSSVRLPLIVFLSLATLSLPTILMGATLPFLVKFLTRSQTELANQVGLLYGFNTLGAAIGTLAAGFILIGLLGIAGSSLFASIVYVCVGGFGLTAARHEHPFAVKKRTPKPVHGKSAEGDAATLLIWLFACSGFVSIAYEVVWFRFLTNISTSSVYAFSGMLGTYLFGLVIGAFVCAKFLAPHKDRLLRYFALVQLGIAVAATFTVAILGKAGTFHSLLSPIVAALVPARAQMVLGDDVP